MERTIRENLRYGVCDLRLNAGNAEGGDETVYLKPDYSKIQIIGK